MAFESTLADELDDFADMLERAAGRVPEELDDEMGELADDIRDTAKAHVPKREGDLKNSITVIKHGPLRYSIGSSLDYAEPIEKGSRPHKITPNEEQVLHFTKPSGEEVFTMEIDHPGHAPNPYLRTAIFRYEEEIEERLGDALERVFEARMG